MEWDDRWNGAFIPREHWHFHRRLLERYGIVLPPGWYGKILRSIRNGKARQIRGGPTPGIYAVRVRERIVFVMANRVQVLTAYPPRDWCWRIYSRFRPPAMQGLLTSGPL